MISIELDENGEPKSTIKIDEMIYAQLKSMLDDSLLKMSSPVVATMMCAMQKAYRCGWAQCGAAARKKMEEQGEQIGVTEHGDKVYATTDSGLFTLAEFAAREMPKSNVKAKEVAEDARWKDLSDFIEQHPPGLGSGEQRTSEASRRAAATKEQQAETAYDRERQQLAAELRTGDGLGSGEASPWPGHELIAKQAAELHDLRAEVSRLRSEAARRSVVDGAACCSHGIRLTEPCKPCDLIGERGSAEAFPGQCAIWMLDERCLLLNGHATEHDFPSTRRRERAQTSGDDTKPRAPVGDRPKSDSSIPAGAPEEAGALPNASLDPLDDSTLREAILRLPMPPIAAINSVANAFRGMTAFLHMPDGRCVKVGPLSDDDADEDAPPLDEQPNAPEVTPPRAGPSSGLAEQSRLKPDERHNFALIAQELRKIVVNSLPIKYEDLEAEFIVCLRRMLVLRASVQLDDGMLIKLRWLRDTVGVDIERMFARAVKEKDGRTPPPLTHVAIRVEDVVWSLPKPYRHHHVLLIIREYSPVKWNDADEKDQGFLDATGKYLTRDEAEPVAFKNKQVKNGKLIGGPLTSEDLW